MHESTYDVAIIGGGHNGLVAAAYLAKAGKKVVVLERLEVVGGAAISAQAFPGLDAKLSRYSYLVSLLPKQIIDELGLEIELAPRRFGSFTPLPNSANGLLIDQENSQATAKSFESIGAGQDFQSWKEFYARTLVLAEKLFGSVLEPLREESEVIELIGEELWKEFFAQPIGLSIEQSFESDLVRGVVMTDALIGTFASNHDATLEANKCFLYHVIGNHTGEWNIPVGGMGSVTTSMAKRAKHFGAALKTNCEVVKIDTDRTITFLEDGEAKSLSAHYILANVSTPVLNGLMGHPTNHEIQGAQVKVNMLLKRLPKLKGTIDPRAAFGGTFHINEGFTQLQTAFEQASRGEIPHPLPCEIYCHSLTDPSILGEDLQKSGAQSLTVFALHTPHALLAGRDNSKMRELLQNAVIDSLNSVLDEDVRDLLMVDANKNLCIETKTTQDLEDALALPGGNIFHAPLSWPFVEDGAALNTPELRWGVGTGVENIFYCGSTARRGGAVSGIGGHNAAMAVLEHETKKLG